jgi:very-short-patch-repair endonuclease
MDTLSPMKALAHAAAEALRKSEFRDPYLSAIKSAWALADSEIEKTLVEAVICCTALNGGSAPAIIQPGKPIVGSERLLIAPQHTIGFYLADIAIVDQLHKRRVVVECDGFEFHDKGLQQAAHDRARDRFFLTRNWPVLRFNGSEITRQVDLCLADIVAYLTGGVDA